MTTWSESYRNVRISSLHSFRCTSNKLLAFDEVAAHDVEWGSLSVDWLSRGHLNEHKQAYVSS